MVGWRQLKDVLKPAWILTFYFQNNIYSPVFMVLSFPLPTGINALP
jgi:hypothetical protein